MATLSSRPSRPAPLAPMLMNSQPPNGSTYPSSSTRQRVAAPIASVDLGLFASPTESEFSEGYDEPDSVRDWVEERVSDWLRSINCHQYVKLFRDNNITGESLLDMDQSHLKAMGIKKIGDRVRIGAQAKLFRSRMLQRPSKRATIRESLLELENPVYTPPSSSSPRPLNSARSAPITRSEQRMSRQLNGSEVSQVSVSSLPGKTSSRSGSPHQELRGTRPQRYAMSPMEMNNREQVASYFNNGSASGRMGITPGDLPQTARYVGQARAIGVPLDAQQASRFNNSGRAGASSDSSGFNSNTLPPDKALIRAIYDTGRSSVVNVEGCKTAEEVILKTLKKGMLNEAHVKSYCFYVLDGIEPNPVYCRRLSDSELLRVALDRTRLERDRLILRKIHTGEPEDEQLRTAASIAMQQLQQMQPPLAPTNGKNNTRSQLKVERLTGESLAAVSYPVSPSSLADRQRHFNAATQDLDRADTVSTTISTRARKLKDFYGARPPSELITSDYNSYFPDVQQEELEKTVRMSIRRSQRLSRATNRLSTASNLSFISSLKDAPPLPAISDSWLHGAAKSIRPLSIVRLGRPSAYRESVASGNLEPLDEESPLEPDRKSYVSFGAESGSDTNNFAITDPDCHTTSQAYFDETGESTSITEGSGSLNEQLSQALAEDGEENDEELTEFLRGDSWENIKYMKGALIGQGSFGSVYLALHAVTAELMAVKQVEIPSNSGTALDAKKNNMLEALKHEIGLLRDLKHPNIVQYLGSSTDDSHLNIFLEYVPGGSVATMLINYGPLGESLIRNFVRQILVGLAYLHSKDIIHRDIKGANILVDNKGRVKISDFGISKRVEASTFLSASKKGNQRVSLQGSVFWMAPEVVRQTTYTRKADIWSLGCLIVEMFTGTHPHPNCTQMMAIFKIGSSPDASPTMPENAGEDAKAFLQRTFELDYEKRPTADELLLTDFCMQSLVQ